MAVEPVTFTLTRSEALVLYAFLARESNRKVAADGQATYRVIDQSEQRVLWDVEAVLESTLWEPLDPSYDDLVAAARNAVRDPDG